MSTQKMNVEIWSDIACPFCYIGKRNLELALDKIPFKDKIDVEWKAFQLDPSFVQDHENKSDLVESLSKKYNRSRAEIEQMQNQITATAKSVGLDYDFSKTIPFNTFDAHRIISKGKEKKLDDQLEEAFFKAYFVEGKNLGNKEVITKVAKKAGLTEDEIKDALENDQYAYEVEQDIQEAQQIGVRGVPFFVMDRKYGVSGAQPVEAFTQTLEKAYEDWSQNQKSPKLDISEGSSCSVDGNCD